MNTQFLVKRQKLLANQIKQLITCRTLMINTAVERTNDYLNIINSGDENTAKLFISCQRKVTMAQPNPMEKQVEGAQYLPAVRHAFKGVAMPKSQIVKSIESEKQLNMGYLLSSLLPVPVNDTVVKKVIDANPLPAGVINEDIVSQYLADRLKQFLSFFYYQDALSGLEQAFQSKQEVTFKEYGITDSDKIDYIADHLYIFDYLYVQQNNLAPIELVAKQNSHTSDLMIISTGKNLDKLTGVSVSPALSNALQDLLAFSKPKQASTNNRRSTSAAYRH